MEHERAEVVVHARAVLVDLDGRGRLDGVAELLLLPGDAVVDVAQELHLEHRGRLDDFQSPLGVDLFAASLAVVLVVALERLGVEVAPHAVADGALAPQRHLELVEVRRALRHVVALRARRLVRLLAAEDVGHEGVVADALLDLGHEQLAELLRVLLHRHLEAEQIREDVHVARRALADLEVREDLLQRAHDGLLGVASLCRRRPVQRVAERRVVVEHLDERAEVARRAEVAQPRRHIGPDVVVRVISQHREQALGLAPDGVRRVPDLLAQAVDAEAVRAAVLF